MIATLNAVLLMISCATVQAIPLDSAEELFKAAGNAYEKGQFEQALAMYERLSDEKLACSALYYNLGNTHYRLGNRGKSILWYERARRLAPRDADIRHNLELARTALQDEEGIIWESLDRLLSPAELAWTVTVLFWILCMTSGLALWRRHSWHRWRLFFAALIAALLVASLWLAGRTINLRTPWAIVVQADAQVRGGPGEQFTVGFSVPEGQRVLILNRRTGWIEIGVPSRSLKGWVKEGAAVRISDGTPVGTGRSDLLS